MCSDAQLTKFFSANAREPIVVETKTTTTTTTVTKRICIWKDANVDLAEIQSLLENDNANTKATTSIKPPIADDTTNENTLIRKRGAKNHSDSVKRKENPNQSLLSSTKIDDFAESNEKKHFLDENQTPFQRASILSPNLSKINKHFEVSNRNVKNKAKKATVKKNVKKMQTAAESDSNQRSTRSKTTASKVSTDSVEKSDYINSLISEYMTLDRKPRRKLPPKKVDTAPVKPAPLPPLEQKDLSAIFENSDEDEDSPMREPFSVSPIHFDGANNDYDYSATMDDQSPVHNQCSSAETSTDEMPAIETAKENNKNKQNKRKFPKSTGESKLSDAKTVKKSRKTSKTVTTTKATKPKQNQTHEQSPIMIYSPSHRGQLKFGADNKLVLTKKMIENKLRNNPGSSQSMLGRLGSSNEMTVDANSRLIYYPNANEQSDDEIVSDEVDFLSIIASKKKPLLVKEIHN